MRHAITALLTISIRTVVEAKSREEALEMARERPVQSQGSGGNELEEWVTSGELDGEPFELEVEQDGGA